MHSIFGPGSPQASATLHLFYWMLGVGSAVWLVVMLATVYAVRARRGAPEADGVLHVSPAEHRGMERVVGVATFVTVLVLFGFLAYDFSVGRLLAQHPLRALTIDITGHQWWWEVVYEDPSPSHRGGTANEIHVPVGEPVQFKLRAADVIHSFWVPNLNGKRDLVPGYESSHWFTADTAGVYRGQCAEFCGMQHAKMSLYIVAEPRAKFTEWLAAGAKNPPPPTDPAALYGHKVFMASGCAVCHTIGGTQARATVGPDLTHLAGRMTIAAGTLANTPANLTRWIQNPDAIKPGVRMPSVDLKPAELSALVAYLETLK